MAKKIKEQTEKISARLSKSKLEEVKRLYGVDSTTELLDQLLNMALDSNFQAEATRSVITGIGAKNKVAHRIIELMPQHTTYIEPFGNTSSILLKKERVDKEIYNDIDSDITNFFMVLRDDPMRLFERCNSLPYSEELYYQFKNAPVPVDKIEQAARFFFLCRASYMGQRTGFRVHSDNGRSFAKLYHKECRRFWMVAKRFEGVEIINQDFRKVIKRYSKNEEALFLVDPPYFGVDSYYLYPFTLGDHIDLIELLCDIKGKFMVCHSYDETIDRLYRDLGFECKKLNTKYMSNYARVDEQGQLKKKKQVLCIYKNF